MSPMSLFKTRRQRMALQSIRSAEGNLRRGLATPELSQDELHGLGWSLGLARKLGIEGGLTRKQVGFTL